MKSGEDKKQGGAKGLVRSLFDSLPVTDYAESAVDAVTDSSVMKDVPVVGTAIGLWQFRNKLKRKKFLKRVGAFYENVSELTLEELAKFDDGFKDADEAEEFVTDLIELIDRLENDQKTLMLGGAFKRLVRKEIDKDNFREMSRAFERLENLDIFFFMHGYHNPYIFEDALGDNLVAVRVCKRTIKIATRQTVMHDPSKVETYVDVAYSVTPFGRLVLETLHQVYAAKIEPENLIKTGKMI